MVMTGGVLSMGGRVHLSAGKNAATLVDPASNKHVPVRK
jgi:hypothetical protein